jgi:hypothetical protein
VKLAIHQGLIALLLWSIGGCGTTARLYNLDTGEVLNATYQNYGTGGKYKLQF